MTRYHEEQEGAAAASRARIRTALVICLLGLLLTVWCCAIALTHLNQSVTAAVHGMDPGLELRKTDDLMNRVGSGDGFPWYTVYRGGKFEGDIYLFTFENAASRRSYLAPLFVSRQITWAVFFDDVQTVQRVWSLSPRFPTGLDARYSRLLDSLKGVACRDLIRGGGLILPADGDELAVPARIAMGDLAISVYASRNSTADLNQLIAEDRTAGLVEHRGFPLFSATTTAGRRIDTASLVGRNTLVLTAQPSCGSCVDEVVESIAKVKAVSSEPWNIVLIMFAGSDGEGAQALMAGVGSSVDIIMDPERKLGNQVFMPDSPYMAVLDRNATVVYKGGGDKIASLLAAIDAVQSGGVPQG
ncbi:MAG TPA: hypothetical protein VN478_03845 [Clostridia bacterium]|nr:hypothetical protein [Clostridia bacterium]